MLKSNLINEKISVLVIGGAGYIGSHVVLELCELGYNVIVFDNLSTGTESNLDNRATFIKGDILNDRDLEVLFNHKIDAIFHFAALKAAGESMNDPSSYSKINISGTINILNQMIKKNIKYFIFSSTAAVYGLPEYLPIDEKHSLKPINYYGFTKLEIEKILNWYSQLKGISFAALRYFNAAGYDSQSRIKGLEKNPANLLPIIMEVAIGARTNVEIYGNDFNTTDGTGVRDYIHVSDLASAHIKSLNYLFKEKKNLTINLSTGKGTSVMDVVKLAEKITCKSIPYKIIKRRDGDASEMVSSNSLANDLLDWNSKESNIENILDSMWTIYSQININ